MSIARRKATSHDLLGRFILFPTRIFFFVLHVFQAANISFPRAVFSSLGAFFP